MIHTLTTLVSGIELLTEISLAGVLLMALDRLAAAVRFTYAAGRFCGRCWYRYGQPALLAAADGISWLLAQIDWAEVRGTVAAGAKALIAMVLLIATEAQPLLVRCSAALGRRYAATLVRAPEGSALDPTPTLAIAATAPLQHPLVALAAELELLTCRELRALTGCHRKASKAQLIALALA
jgi:hypothetical protein